MDEQANNTNLFKKIVEVRKEIDYFQKDSKGYKYSYVSGSQVLSKIKGKMDEVGLILMPQMDNITDEKEGKNYIVRGNITYTWIDAESGESISIPWKLYGAQDDISKAFGSGLTYSERYFLLKFFGVPTDDDDPDTTQGNKPQQANRAQQIPQQGQQKRTSQNQAQKQTEQPKLASMKQKDDITKAAKALSTMRNAPMDKIFSSLGISILEQVTEKEATEALRKLEKWYAQAKNEQEQAGGQAV
ncbi:single-stranded DNA-binding protein [Salicibibacter halophilus]|uniref:Single-stranded DNA-binding protein n=1 Tax=Salicibibacter halophilus TaxID=2502791 RepID=A0A514LEF9_9BACI|nr:ERF family protein [Salicibibacter halophilus]QDI90243.1 single-stranded DNA-binding protein [Salicibibacter halophilus]